MPWSPRGPEHHRHHSVHTTRSVRTTGTRRWPRGSLPIPAAGLRVLTSKHVGPPRSLAPSSSALLRLHREVQPEDLRGRKPRVPALRVRAACAPLRRHKAPSHHVQTEKAQLSRAHDCLRTPPVLPVVALWGFLRHPSESRPIFAPFAHPPVSSTTNPGRSALTVALRKQIAHVFLGQVNIWVGAHAPRQLPRGGGNVF